jgi:RNA polymerase sigma-70 factor (ECF subfamily)
MPLTSVSLLVRLTTSAHAWTELVDLYTPLIHGWLRRHGVSATEADDHTQEILTLVVRRLPEFTHNGRPGAFRTWLRSITLNCVRDQRKLGRLRLTTPPGVDAEAYLTRLADPADPLSQAWNREHDHAVLRRLLARIQPDFAVVTWQAFTRFVLRTEPAATVARELGLTTNAVFIAKSRVLARLRQEADGLVEA